MLNYNHTSMMPYSMYLVFPVLTVKPISLQALYNTFYCSDIIAYHRPHKPIPDGCHSYPVPVNDNYGCKYCKNYIIRFISSVLYENYVLVVKWDICIMRMKFSSEKLCDGGFPYVNTRKSCNPTAESWRTDTHCFSSQGCRSWSGKVSNIFGFGQDFWIPSL